MPSVQLNERRTEVNSPCRFSSLKPSKGITMHGLSWVYRVMHRLFGWYMIPVTVYSPYNSSPGVAPSLSVRVIRSPMCMEFSSAIDCSIRHSLSPEGSVPSRRIGVLRVCVKDSTSTSTEVSVADSIHVTLYSPSEARIPSNDAK